MQEEITLRQLGALEINIQKVQNSLVRGNELPRGKVILVKDGLKILKKSVKIKY
jgi:hypothetical protein